MPHKYFTCASYILLLITSGYAFVFYVVDYGSGPPVASFGIIAVYSALGAYCWGHTSPQSNIEDVYKKMDVIQKISVLAIIDIDMGWLCGISIIHTIMHLGLIAWPLYEYTKNGEVSEKTLDYVTGVNAGSLGIISFMRFNVFGMAAAGIYAVNHFFLQLEQEYIEYPKEDVYNYAYCIFVVMVKFAIANVTPKTEII